MTKLKPGELPSVAKEYMGEGNTPPVEGGRFPVLELSHGLGRIVGRVNQSFADLRKDSADKGLIAPQPPVKEKRDADLSKPAKRK